MGLLRKFLLAALLPLLGGCEAPYLTKSAYDWLMLPGGESYEKAMKDPKITDKEKHKLELAQEAREFAIHEMSLKSTKNYTSFVKLDHPYLTYVVNASPKWKLENYLWDFPIVGKVPYKGFYSQADADAEAKKFKDKDYDTYVRGVSAYSSLGRLTDPLYSSMTNYEDYELVNTVIHETTHATIYIKGSADFNERLATFMGNKGMELFYLKKEGENSQTLKMIKEENADETLFSKFISKEVADLKKWYDTQTAHSEEAREKRIAEIQTRFKTEIKPKLKTQIYTRFETAHLNNARLLLYKTYLNDLSDFEKLYEKSNKSFSLFIKNCETLKDEDDPDVTLKIRLTKKL